MIELNSKKKYKYIRRNILGQTLKIYIEQIRQLKQLFYI